MSASTVQFVHSELSEDAKIEVSIRCQKVDKVVHVYSNVFWPHRLVVLPWCCLVPTVDTVVPSSTPYFQLYQANESETVPDIYHQFISRGPEMKGLLIIMNSSQFNRQESAIPVKEQIKDPSFLIVVISKHHKSRIMDMIITGGEFQATVFAPAESEQPSLSHVLLPQPSTALTSLMKAVQYIIQNKINITLNYSPPEIDPSGKRLIVFFMEAISILHLEAYMEVTSFSKKYEEMMELFLFDAHFNNVFQNDFIFFFALAKLHYYHSSSVSKIPPIVIELIRRCIVYLLKTPLEDVMKHLTCFIDMGDLSADVESFFGSVSVFKEVASSFLMVSEVYHERVSSSESLHSFLLTTSLAIKLYCHCNPKKIENLWSKKLNEYFKSSGFNGEDIVGLEKGLESMTVILSNHPQLMIEWKEFCSIFTHKIHLLNILREFINISVKYLMRLSYDTSFRISFLQPVTDFYLNASKKKSNISQFTDAVEDIVQNVKDLIDYLISVIHNYNTADNDDGNWCNDDYEKILKDWIKIMFNFIDLSNPLIRNELIKLIPIVKESSWISYDICFHNEFEKKLEAQCHTLSSDVIIELVTKTSDTFNKSKVIIDYLGRSDIPQSICEQPFSDVLILAIKLAPDSDDLIIYLKNVMQSYTKAGKPLQFLYDILTLDVHPSTKLFEEKLDQVLSDHYSTPVMLNLLKDEIGTLLSHVPLSSNYTNSLIVKRIIGKSIDSWDPDDALKAAASVFFNDMREEHFSSARLRAALFIISSYLKKVQFYNYSFLYEHSQALTALCESFQAMWKAFTSFSQDTTVAGFLTISVDVSECLDIMDIVYRLKSVIVNVWTMCQEKEVTYDDLKALQLGYNTYNTIYQCISTAFASTEGYQVTCEKLEELLHLYDHYVMDIENLLVRKSPNMPELATQHVKTVLLEYDITFPEDLEYDLTQTVVPSSRLTNSMSIFESETSKTYAVYIYRPVPECTLGRLEHLATRLKEFLEPILESIDFIVFNNIHKSQILTTCIRHFLNEQQPILENNSKQSQLEQLNTAAMETKDFFGALVNDTSSMETMCKVFSSEDLRKFDLNQENEILQLLYELLYEEKRNIKLAELLSMYMELSHVHKHIINLQRIGTSCSSIEKLQQEVIACSESLKMSYINEYQEKKVKDELIEKQKKEIEIKDMEIARLTEVNSSLKEKKVESAETVHWVIDGNEIDVLETSPLVGKGGWGNVSVVTFRGIQVAAKCLHDVILSDFNISLFNREMEICSHIRHPNLVQFIGAVNTGNPIILTELMTTTLRAQLERSRLPIPQIIQISSDVSLALNYLHLWKPHPILHRDVSSSNVLLDPCGPGQWKTKVSDFGSANFLHRVSATSVGVGSPSYAAPESLFPDRHSPSMDVYSLGVMIMEMCLHQPPAPTSKERELQAKNIRISSSLKNLVQKCLVANELKRPNMSQVLQSLNKI